MIQVCHDRQLFRDSLEVSHTDEIAPEVKSVKSIAIVLPTTEPKLPSKKIERIASRHWHDPFSVPAPLLTLRLNAKRPTGAPTVPAWSAPLHQSLDRHLFVGAAIATALEWHQDVLYGP